MSNENDWKQRAIAAESKLADLKNQIDAESIVSDSYRAERDYLRSKLAEIEAQEPVRWSWKLTNGYLVNMYESKEDAISDMTGFGEGDPVALYSLPVQPSPAVAVTDHTIPDEDRIDQVSLAMRKAYSLGQTYWMQADSESLSQQRKSDATAEKFEALMEETKAMLSSTPTPPSAEQAPTDNAIPELDLLCEKYNNGEINLRKLVCAIWNKAIVTPLREQPDSAAFEPVSTWKSSGDSIKCENCGNILSAHAQQRFCPTTKPQRITEQDAREIWVHGYASGHNDGIGCGHSLAPRCKHSGEKEFYADDIAALLAKLNEHREPDYKAQRDELAAENERLNLIINSPQKDDFIRAVSTEAEHQRQRWGSDHDGGKTPADWFWLIGYLAGKALHAHAAGNVDKTEHHIITTAAACANWHRSLFGKTNMRPGIDPAIAKASASTDSGVE